MYLDRVVGLLSASTRWGAVLDFALARRAWTCRRQCDIRLQIDAEAEVSVRGDLVHIRTISGRDGRDDSEFNVPLPARDVQGFRFEVADGRGEIRLLSPPSRRSGYQAVYTFGTARAAKAATISA